MLGVEASGFYSGLIVVIQMKDCTEVHRIKCSRLLFPASAYMELGLFSAH